MRDTDTSRGAAAVALALAAALAPAFAPASARAEAPFSFAATPGKLPKDVIALLYDANRGALLANADAVARNRALPGVLAASPETRHADMMETYIAKNFGPDALVEAERIGNGIRVRAAQKARLLPQVRAALLSPRQ